jgi:transposase
MSALPAQHLPGVRIEYLPPYSPDLNPIEEAFSKIKHWVRRHQEYYSTAEDDGIIYDMLEVLDIVTPSDACGYFIHAGYF